MFSVDKLPEKYLMSEEEDVPVLVVFLDTENNSLCNYIIGDDTKMFGQTINILDGIILLMASYYVFDLEYPIIYSQVLGIIQHWVLGDIFTQTKSTHWMKVSDQLFRDKE